MGDQRAARKRWRQTAMTTCAASTFDACAMLVVASAAVICQVAAGRFHGQLKRAIAAGSGDVAALSANTEWFRLVGLGLAVAAIGAACLEAGRTGQVSRACIYSLLLGFAAAALYLIL